MLSSPPAKFVLLSMPFSLTQFNDSLSKKDSDWPNVSEKGPQVQATGTKAAPTSRLPQVLGGKKVKKKKITPKLAPFLQQFSTLDSAAAEKTKMK